MRFGPLSLRLLLVFLPMLALLAACGEEAEGGRAAPAATVTTLAVEAKPWRDTIQALGTARANESVLVTAKVTETVVRVNFEDGDLVEAGDVLVDLSGRAEVAGHRVQALRFRRTNPDRSWNPYGAYDHGKAMRHIYQDQYNAWGLLL